MSVVITKSFTDQFTGTGGGGTAYLNGNVTDRMTSTIEVYVAWNLKNVRCDFVAADDTIEITNELDQRTWTTQEFQVGDTVTIVGTASNDGDVTITAISEDGRTITVAEALVSESATDASFHGVTPVEAIDLSYNLINNDGAESYESFIDEGTEQRYQATAVDATDTLHTINFRAVTKSIGWVTNEITDATVNETDEVTIIGAGVTDYRQYFTIVHQFIVAPLYLVSQANNFNDAIAPAYYRNGRSLKYICKVDARFDSNNPTPDHTGKSITPNGSGQWLDVAPLGRKPEYYVSAITYVDNATSDVLTELDINKLVDVTITLKSESGVFTTATPFRIGFIACPNDESRYTNTPDTNMVQNYLLDDVLTEVGAAAADGIQFGTGYQVLVDVAATRPNANTITITLQVDFGATCVSYFESLDDDQRQYLLFVSVQNPAVTTTKGSDRVTCMADFNSVAWDRTDTTLFEFTGSGMGAYQYPDSATVKWGAVNGQSGTPFVIEAPFRVYNDPDADGNTPTIKTITWQVVAQKTNFDDFVIEERVHDCNAFVKLLDVQQIDIDETRGFTTYEDDPFNAVTVVRDDPNDTGTQAAYIARYAIILRWEDWISKTVDATVSDDGTLVQNPITRYIESVDEKWSHYSGVEGWTLAMRFECVVTDLNGVDQTYRCDLPMSSIDNTLTWAGSSGTSRTVYFMNEVGGINYGSILSDDITLVRVVYAGDYPIDPTTEDGWYGYFMMNIVGTSVFESRFASSEVPSEEDSPWLSTAPPADGTADISYANGNVRIDIFNPTATTTSQIKISAYFDSSQYAANDLKFVLLDGIGRKTFTT